MREFKFRAFEKDSQEMFYPDTTNNNEYFFSGFMDGVLKVATSPYSDEKDYVLMQYTGLKDKNGKEIYEGDILKVPDLYETPENTSTTYTNWIVTFDNGSFCLGNQPMHEDYEYISEECKIIGNVCENPEIETGD